jgi:hypothetical protein
LNGRRAVGMVGERRENSIQTARCRPVSTAASVIAVLTVND